MLVYLCMLLVVCVCVLECVNICVFTHSAESKHLRDEDGGDNGHLVQDSHGPPQVNRGDLRDVQGNHHSVHTCRCVCARARARVCMCVWRGKEGIVFKLAMPMTRKSLALSDQSQYFLVDNQRTTKTHTNNNPRNLSPSLTCLLPQTLPGHLGTL